MSLLGTGQTSQAGSTAEAEALIAEARARARRRRLRIAVVVLGAVALAAGSLAASGAFTGGRSTGTGGGGAVSAAAWPAGPPAYFVDATTAGSEYSTPEIRSSATGKVVSSTLIGQLDDYDPPYGLTATGPDSFVVGLMTPSDCSAQFFSFRINGRGKAGALTRVGPTLPGELTAMAASAGGGLIGFAIERSGCPKAGRGSYLGVLDPVTGRIRQWTDAPAYSSQLSMSADGRAIAFTQSLTKPMPGTHGGFQITGYQVRVLATDAASGPVEARSRVAATISAQDSQLAAPAVVLSATGTSFYLCLEPFTFPQRGATKITDSASIVAYQTATGRQTGVLASFAASYPASAGGGYAPLTLGCSTMALDPSGRFLLVPYRQTIGNQYQPPPIGSLTAAMINVVTGARSDWTTPLADDGQGAETINVAW